MKEITDFVNCLGIGYLARLYGCSLERMQYTLKADLLEVVAASQTFLPTVSLLDVAKQIEVYEPTSDDELFIILELLQGLDQLQRLSLAEALVYYMKEEVNQACAHTS